MRSSRLTALAIFVLTFIAYAVYAPQDTINPQHVTRLGLTLSIIEDGRLDIDRFAERTIDKALVDGRYYADKPPGLSLLAIPSVAVTRIVLGALGMDAGGDAQFKLYLQVATIATVGVLGALAVSVLYLVALKLGARESGALFAAMALGVGTPYFGWSTVFFSHAVSGSLLLIGFALALWKRPLLCGLVLGYALVVDLTAAPAAAAIGVLCLTINGFRAIVSLGIGGVIGLMPLPVYNWLAFGSPFKLGYSAVVGFAAMQQGFGMTVPNPGVLIQILFGFYRGLIPLAPILLLVPLGLLEMKRGAVLTIVATIASFLLINMSYTYWSGGASVGPRHIIAMLPVACIALAFVWPRAAWGRAAVLLLLLPGVIVGLIVACTTVFVQEDVANPLVETLLPRFRDYNAGEIWVGLGVVLALGAMLARSILQDRRATS